MEKNIANIWLQDARGLVRAKVGDEAFFSYCQELESTSLRTPAASPIELTSSKSSTETAEHYDYFDPYLQTEALKGSTQDPTADPISICSEGSITQALEQLLTCKDVLETQTSWEVDHQKDELPLHQLPGWTQQDCSLMEDWQQNLSCSMSHLESESSSSLIGDTPNHGRQMITETPVGLFDPTTEDIFPPANHLSQSATVMSFLGDQILRRPSHIISSKVAAARRHRILLRQKSAPHQRGPSHSNGSGSSPRALKKMYVTKLAKELTCSNGQGHNMDSLRFLFHKVLQTSDVSNLGRIVISKKEAESHLPYLAMKEGILITMEDFDTGQQWTFRYRFWPNCRSRMYLLESTGDFVRAHRLTKGDVLLLWRHSTRGTYVIRGMSAFPSMHTIEVLKKVKVEE
ncbi:uncharacterized protein [Physcomitrium patens]|uniref:TF-B3 domain-containing protein n=1 Tax=Physcomitrium patens TaxID=3218 RepID=A0A2K1IQZ5_PHYPA|nr:uncharacterized protein LOC112273861 isoform X2 [Physcomitrium patens]PNR31706.1 hypothetical protein PHYPA_025828 [Physcomitrium patens]|eukprot:XP_024358637.1 uncharacterized protein LOC112273861 isoform X2 [Physcomitrella patens]